MTVAKEFALGVLTKIVVRILIEDFAAARTRLWKGFVIVARIFRQKDGLAVFGRDETKKNEENH